MVLVDPDTRDNAAKLAENGLRFLDGVEQLCKFAAEYLEAVGQQVGGVWVVRRWLKATGPCFLLTFPGAAVECRRSMRISRSCGWRRSSCA